MSTVRKLSDDPRSLLSDAGRLIKQRAIRDVLDLRERLAALDGEAKRLREALDKQELVLMHAVERGDRTEPGEATIAVQVTPGRRTPRWKEEFAKVTGPEAVERVIAATEPGPAARKLVVSVGGVVQR